MIEPRRVDDLPQPDPTQRDGQIDALLMDGLDRYFSGRYDDAIHLWTRVLFIDRAHARARAYIDRARSAMAERQRQSDEKLQASRQSLERGETDAARVLLSEAIAAGGEDDRAAALRARLDGTERLHRVSAMSSSAARPALTPVPGWSWPGPSRAVAGVAGTALLAIVLAVAIAATAIQDAFSTSGRTQELSSVGAPALPVMSSAEVAMVRARTLFDRGRLAEALVALDRIGPDSAARPQADRLRIEIQGLLLAGNGRAAAREEPGAVSR
jgi:hypothetical protein